MRGSCGSCGATWTGATLQHCPSCCHTFTGATAGDKHRTGDHAVLHGPDRRRCRTAAEMLEVGLAPRTTPSGLEVWGREAQERGFWLTQRESAGPPGVPEGNPPETGVQGLSEWRLLDDSDAE